MIGLFRVLVLGLALAGCGSLQASDAQQSATDRAPVSAARAAHYLVFEVEPDDGTDYTLNVLRRRLERSEFAGVIVEKQAPDRLRVEAPGTSPDQIDRLTALLIRPGVLTFNMVDVNANPADYEIGVERNGRIALPDDSLGGQLLVTYQDPVVTGSDISDARQSFDDPLRLTRPAIAFKLDSAATQRFGRATSQNVGKSFAIVLDNRIVSAPRIISPILNGMGMITGRYTEEEAKDLAAILGGGALPGALTVVERGLN